METLITSLHSSPALFNPLAFALVFVGSAFIFLVSFGFKDFAYVAKAAFASFFKRTIDAKQMSEQILRLSRAHRDRAADVANVVESSDPFLREGYALISEGLIDAKGVAQILQARVFADYQKRSSLSSRLSRFAQYPIALGVLGAAIGCSLAVEGLLSSADSQATATMLSFGFLSVVYGCVLSFFAAVPVANRFAEVAKKRRHLQTLVVVGCRLMSSKTNPIVVAEEINSFLTEGERVDWKQVADSAPSDASSGANV